MSQACERACPSTRTSSALSFRPCCFVAPECKALDPSGGCNRLPDHVSTSLGEWSIHLEKSNVQHQALSRIDPLMDERMRPVLKSGCGLCPQTAFKGRRGGQLRSGVVKTGGKSAQHARRLAKRSTPCSFSVFTIGGERNARYGLLASLTTEKRTSFAWISAQAHSSTLSGHRTDVRSKSATNERHVCGTSGRLSSKETSHAQD